MTHRDLLRLLLAALLLCLWLPELRAQQIVSMNVPRHLCAGDTLHLSMGRHDTHNVVVREVMAVESHSERIFLPDGKECGGHCSYRSPLTFTQFPANASITSVNDIRYVRLNIEHSYIGDIYINITCPSGLKADLMRKNTTGSNTDCADAIPSESIGWRSGNNANASAFFGDANDEEASYSRYACDSTAYGNEPGTGWNYCWSNSTTHGYSYAPGDGYIYRADNASYVNSYSYYGYGHYVIDSSNVHLGTNFYHPDDNFSALLGCPLNGEWYIEVVDGYGQDNGYVFEWELALNEHLIPAGQCDISGYDIVGPGVTAVSDSTFIVVPPAGLTHDSTATYTFRVVNSCGEYIDTTASITFHAPRYVEAEDEGCGTYRWHGVAYDRDTCLTRHHTTRWGCDSTHTLCLTIHPTYLMRVSETIVERALPHTYGRYTFTGAVADTLLTATSVQGCDSNTVYTLIVLPAHYASVDTAVCADALPFRWNGRSYVRSQRDTITLSASDGADSVVMLTLTVLPTYTSDVVWQRVENDLPVEFLQTSFASDGDTLFHLASAAGCDSAIHFTLVVHRNHTYHYSSAICADALPYTWLGHTFTDTEQKQIVARDRYGADSIVVLSLTVHPVYSVDTTATLCEGQRYPTVVGDLDSGGRYTLPLSTLQGCDSTVHLTLVVHPSYDTVYRDTLCAALTPYRFGRDLLYHSGTYRYPFATAYGCDSSVTLQLTVKGEGLEAAIRAIPTLVTPADPMVRLYDASSGSRTTLWTIDDEPRHFTFLDYSYPTDRDSIVLTLVATSDDGCYDTARTVLRIDRAALVLPNAFTPNRESNNTWQPVLRDIDRLEIWIYNRDGLLVQHGNSVDFRWDGTDLSGNACRTAAYVYRLRYSTRLKPNQTQEQSGTIHLIR